MARRDLSEMEKRVKKRVMSCEERAAVRSEATNGSLLVIVIGDMLL
jgi:hypothetical protein